MLKRSHLRFRTEFDTDRREMIITGEATFRASVAVSDMLLMSRGKEYVIADHKEEIYQQALSSLLGQLRERIRERLIKNIENAMQFVSQPYSIDPVREAERLLSQIMTMFRGED